MKIHSLQIKNFRALSNLALDVDTRLNIFIGVNGAGKTSILDAISKNIAHSLNHLIYDNESDTFVNDIYIIADDINNAFKTCSIELIYQFNTSKFQYKIGLSHDKFSVDYEGNLKKHLSTLHNSLTNETNLPLFVYYNSNKNFNTSLNKSDQSSQRIPQLNTYGNLGGDVFSFKNFIAWFRDQEDIENEIRLRQDAKYKSSKLEIVRSAILNVFSILGNTNYESLTIMRAKPMNDTNFNFSVSSGGELFLKKGSKYLKVSQLSSGEKNILLTVADIAAKIAQLNPITTNHVLHEARGVVLIDEIEQHLHPAWQRKIIIALMNTFKNIQFFLSTHSENIVLSILNGIENKKLNHKEVSIFNLEVIQNEISIDKQELNEHGQMEGGLKNFYIDELETIGTNLNLL
jgi:predicted ATP-binding protein involved in virulence